MFRISSHTLVIDLCASQGFVPAKSHFPPVQGLKKLFLHLCPFAVMLTPHKLDFYSFKPPFSSSPLCQGWQEFVSQVPACFQQVKSAGEKFFSFHTKWYMHHLILFGNFCRHLELQQYCDPFLCLERCTISSLLSCPYCPFFLTIVLLFLVQFKLCFLQISASVQCQKSKTLYGGKKGKVRSFIYTFPKVQWILFAVLC